MAREDVESIDDRGITAWDMHDAKAFAELLADDFVWTDTTMPEPMRTKDQATRTSPAC
jgi:ketosteroid isomerase-like protein